VVPHRHANNASAFFSMTTAEPGNYSRRRADLRTPKAPRSRPVRANLRRRWHRLCRLSENSFLARTEENMSERTERGTLNHLIEICRDGERGFRYAANHVRADDVKELFLEVAGQREQFAGELIPYAQRLGGHEEGDGTFAASLHRSWMGIRDAIAGHDETAIIREVERGESAALTAYQDAVNGMLPPTARDVIERQCEAVRWSHGRVHALLGR
jgi:uncharacterized protein (TIGR02284 family)